MRAANYWEQFLNTGKIDDYLAYRMYGEEAIGTFDPLNGADRDEGVSRGAGTGQCYRDDFKSGTGRGI